MKLWIVLAAATAALAQERLVLEDLARAPGGRGGRTGRGSICPWDSIWARDRWRRADRRVPRVRR